MKLPDIFEQAIIVDEVGIEIGRHGSFLFRTGYQPIFRLEGDAFVPVAVAASTLIQRLPGTESEDDGRSPEPSAAERIFLDTLQRMLHLRNSTQLDRTDLRLLLPFDLKLHGRDGFADQIALMAAERDRVEPEAPGLVSILTDTESLDQSDVALCAETLKRHGIGLAIDDFGAGFPTLERLGQLSPTIVKIEGNWFRRVAAVPRAAKLLRPLVTGFRDQGSDVLVDGIEVAAHLEAALESNATLFQGGLLARVAPAGAILADAPRPVTSLLSPHVPADNVVRLSQHRRD